MSFLDEEKYSATSQKHPADLQTWPKPKPRMTQGSRLGETEKRGDPEKGKLMC